MGLKDIQLKSEYRSLLNDIAKEFYIPSLSNAISYKRAVGFFSSTALIEIAIGIDGLIQNGGRIQIIASPYLSNEDIKAIQLGYELREVIEKSLIRELEDAKDGFEEISLDLLTHLIANNVLDIKIAITEQNGLLGMYHEKMGIIEDKNGDKIAFSGSMNESITALKMNYETIDVFCSWNDSESRVQNKENAFFSIWNNIEPNIETMEFSSLNTEIIKKYQKTDNYTESIKNFKNAVKQKTKKINGVAIPEWLNLHEYQVKAIDNWENQDFCGIFDMATGTGKTLTGLGAAASLSDYLNGNFALFIVCPYQHLVEQWVDDINEFGIDPIIGYSNSAQKDWKKRLKDAILDQKLKVKNRNFFCFISTNATFASKFVQDEIEKIKSDAMLLVDEAHNFGASYLSKTLTNKFRYRLALSATLNRHNDEFGTQKLFDYFGEKCIEYTLEQAIEEGKLTKYKYNPIVVTLSDLELAKYSEITFEMGKCIIFDKNGKKQLSEKGKRLALARARVVAGAEDKIRVLEKYIQPYTEDKHILVYCGATKMLNENQECSDVDEIDLRQIDVVTNLLGNKLNMKVSQFTSKEDSIEREQLKREFDKGENIQALIAIKCLDEGVNIPKIKVAFILASTTNPKEYIQRRGRVLRLSEGKDYAEIYDFITLPMPLDNVHSLTELQVKSFLTLVKNELSRAEEFARISMNRINCELLIDEIKENYGIKEEFDFREEFDLDGVNYE